MSAPHALFEASSVTVQRLLADGHGFAGKGGWKTAALVRTMKVMAGGMTGGTSGHVVHGGPHLQLQRDTQGAWLA